MLLKSLLVCKTIVCQGDVVSQAFYLIKTNKKLLTSNVLS